MQLNSLNDLFMHNLTDLMSAEQMLSDKLPKLSDQAKNQTLKQDLRKYADDARDQAGKIEEMFRMMDQPVETEECKGMQGLIEEADEVIGMAGDPDVKDAAIIESVQKMKHYEIAGYGTVKAFASMLGRNQIADMAADVLSDEERIDKELTNLAMSQINPEAKAA